MMAEKRDELRRYVVTPLQTNCYAYVSDGECLVVDPGGSGAQIAAVLDDVRVRCVAATHGHGDHVGGVSARPGPPSRFMAPTPSLRAAPAR